MKKRFCRLNRDGWYLSILNSQRGADQKEIWDSRLPTNRDRTFLADKLRYLLKSPKAAYRIYRTERVTREMAQIKSGMRAMTRTNNGTGPFAPILRTLKSSLGRYWAIDTK
jgi:hypothetical protein